MAGRSASMAASGMPVSVLNTKPVKKSYTKGVEKFRLSCPLLVWGVAYFDMLSRSMLTNRLVASADIDTMATLMALSTVKIIAPLIPMGKLLPA